ncbi:MAG: hypothetical protein ACJARR_003938 [Pseudophaeobacter arcticus]|jgi:hypothetical protein
MMGKTDEGKARYKKHRDLDRDLDRDLPRQKKGPCPGHGQSDREEMPVAVSIREDEHDIDRIYKLIISFQGTVLEIHVPGVIPVRAFKGPFGGVYWRAKEDYDGQDFYWRRRRRLR